MNYVSAPLKGLLCALVGLLAPVYMLVLVFFIKKDAVATKSGSTDDSSYIIRGDLPRWARWAQTMDCRFPGGMYEDSVRESYSKGFLWCSYVWAGLRNRAQGLAYALGKPAVDFLPSYIGFFKREFDSVWQRHVNLGFVTLTLGWEVYRLRDGSFWAVPIFTGRFGQ